MWCNDHAPVYTLGATSGGLLLAPGRMWISVTARVWDGVVRWECGGVGVSCRLVDLISTLIRFPINSDVR